MVGRSSLARAREFKLIKLIQLYWGGTAVVGHHGGGSGLAPADVLRKVSFETDIGTETDKL